MDCPSRSGAAGTCFTLTAFSDGSRHAPFVLSATRCASSSSVLRWPPRWFSVVRMQLAPLMVALKLAAVWQMCPTRRGDVCGSSWGHGCCASAELYTDVMHRTWFLTTDPRMMDAYISGLVHNTSPPSTHIQHNVFLWQASQRMTKHVQVQDFLPCYLVF